MLFEFSQASSAIYNASSKTLWNDAFVVVASSNYQACHRSNSWKVMITGLFHSCLYPILKNELEMMTQVILSGRVSLNVIIPA